MEFNQPGPSTVSHNVLLIFSVVSLSTMMSTLLSQCDMRPPEITLNPVAQIANVDSRVEFLVQANYGRTYAWTKDGVPLPEKTEASLIIEKVALADEGSYACAISNDKGSVTSESASLSINDPPVIVQNFLPQSIFEGQPLSLVGEVSGTTPLAFRILKNGKPIGESNQCSWQIENASVSDSGNYSFGVTNVTGVSLRSDAVKVVVRRVIVPEGEVEGETPTEGEVEGEHPVEGEIEGEIEGEPPQEGEGEPPLEGEPEPILCQQNFCATANSGDDTSAPITKSFCGYFADLYNGAPRGLLGPYVKLIDYFTPAGDMNGQSWVDKRAGDDKLITYQIGGNGIPDCSFEFRLLETVLLNPNFCICDSGLNHKMVHDAWNFNSNHLSQDFAGLYWTLADSVLPGFKQIMCAHVTIGDGSADYSVENYLTANGSGGLVLGIAYLLGKDIANKKPDLTTYQTLDAYFGPQGDADGDGWTNAEEFAVCGNDPEAYVYAALNSDVTPAR